MKRYSRSLNPSLKAVERAGMGVGSKERVQDSNKRLSYSLRGMEDRPTTGLDPMGKKKSFM